MGQRLDENKENQGPNLKGGAENVNKGLRQPTPVSLLRGFSNLFVHEKRQEQIQGSSIRENYDTTHTGSTSKVLKETQKPNKGERIA